jgi:hypothetical protein
VLDGAVAVTLGVLCGNTERYVLTGDRPPPRPEDVRSDPGLLGPFAAVEASFSWTRGAALAGAGADVLLAGHTHQPTDRRIGRVRAVNAGSISNPVTDDLRASYVIVHADRHGHRLDHRRVQCDKDAFLRRLRDSGHPAHDHIASFQDGRQVRYAARRPRAPQVST